MNSASQDLPRHIAALRAHAQHPTRYEKAYDYFMREFAGDDRLVALGERHDSPDFEQLVAFSVSRVMKRELRLHPVVLIRIAAVGFLHGWAIAVGHALAFFFFESDQLGIIGVTPGLHEGIEVVRFRASMHMQHDLN